jgi:PhnB protein
MVMPRCISFYKSGGEFTMVLRFKDMANDEFPIPAHENKIMHIALPIGKNILMGMMSPKVCGK